ncbi:MAG: YidC/Oxa1 family membrane protein insertase [Caldilineaceae bacterium]
MKRKHLLLLLMLGILVVLLSGCGVDRHGVDVMNTAPSGWWQTIIVWPLAKTLIYLDGLLRDANIPYHWGFAIIAFTILVRLVLFPLTVTQIRGMQAQKELQPKLQEIQKKYGKDREKLIQEQTKLYKESGINPLSGCLPLVLQMPILFGLYSALVATGPALQNSRFFWIPDLSFPHYGEGTKWITDRFQSGDYLGLASYLILPVLLMISQFVMQKWMTPTPATTDNNQAGMMKQMTLMMTFMFGFFTVTVPAGLTLYWVTSNALQMLQQWVTTSDRFNFSGTKTATAGGVAGGGSASLVSTTNGVATTEKPPTETKTGSGQANKPSSAARRRKAKRK